MPTKSFIEELARLAGSTEREVEATIRWVLARVMLDLRRLVQRLSPDGAFRIYQWQQLEREALPLLAPLARQLGATLPSQLSLMEPGVRGLAAKLLGLPAPAPRYRPPAVIAEQTVVGSATIAETIGTEIAQARFAAKQAAELDQLVRTELLRETPTREIADKVIKVTTRRGQPTPIIQTGSFANRILNRVKNMVSGAVWAVTNGNLQEVWKEANPPRWRWNAVLDPATCPICAPLDNEEQDSVEAFPYQPPVHPNCRCVILPIMAT